METIKRLFVNVYLCLVRVLTQLKKCFGKYSRIILACTEAPDFTDVIVFNDQSWNCNGLHTEVKCTKRFCNFCRLNRVISYIDNAQVCLDIAQLVISNTKLYEAVVAAWNRGVNVRIVADFEMLDCRSSRIRKLCSHLIPIHVAGDRCIMHHKFAIIDGQERIHQLDTEERNKARLLRRRGVVMTGSLNWTTQGFSKNYENVVITSNNKVQAQYQKIFDYLYMSGKPYTATFDDS